MSAGGGARVVEVGAVASVGVVAVPDVVVVVVEVGSVPCVVVVVGAVGSVVVVAVPDVVVATVPLVVLVEPPVEVVVGEAELPSEDPVEAGGTLVAGDSVTRDPASDGAVVDAVSGSDDAVLHADRATARVSAIKLRPSRFCCFEPGKLTVCLIDLLNRG